MCRLDLDFLRVCLRVTDIDSVGFGFITLKQSRAEVALLKNGSDNGKRLCRYSRKNNDKMENFLELGLPQSLLRALEKMNFSKPTPIQAKAIPLALQGRDILGSAQTGTGKTAAFAVPLLAHLIKNKQSGAIVMTPTRELAAQVAAAIHQMLAGTPDIKTALLIGGDSMGKQLGQLRARPRVIVGTPGRINDHLQQGSLRLSETDFLVLDETDRMLDMGFENQIEKIVRRLPAKRQTLLFSATLPSYIVKLAEKYQNKPERIAVGSTHTPIDKIKQEMIRVSAGAKYDELVRQLEARQGSILVFVKTKRGADRITKKLNESKHSAEAIHGNLSQSRRTRVIQAFRDKRHRIMVATDVAARGLDIPHIEHVINYDLPQVPEDYIHRIGRTARAGAEGSAVCFITPEDGQMWDEINFLMNPEAKRQFAAMPRQQQQPRKNNNFGGGGFRRGGGGGGSRDGGGGRDRGDREAHAGRSRAGYSARLNNDAPRSNDRPRSNDAPRSNDRPRSNDAPRSYDRPRSNDRPASARPANDRPRSYGSDRGPARRERV